MKMLLFQRSICAFFSLGLLSGDGLLAGTGKAFDEIRQQLLSKFDADDDGFLNASEREKMRLAARQRSENSLRQKRRKGGRWTPPKAWLERYDANGDGEFDDREWKAAFAGQTERLTRQYDSDEDGILNEQEKATLVRDFHKGAFASFDRMIAMHLGGINSRFEKGNSSKDRWTEFDLDGDGKASEKELEAIRSAKIRASKK